MAKILLTTSVALAAVAAVMFQVYLKEPVYLSFGVGKTFQPISDFPAYNCRRIHDPRLQACEDMWLSESTRQLFLACSDPPSRKHWLPALHRLNTTGRPKDDAVIAMDIDKPDAAGDSFVYRVLSTPQFPGTNGDGRLYLVGLHGIDSPVVSEEEGKDGRSVRGKITIALVNHRPSINTTSGEVLDNSRVGANSTIEIFETGPEATELRHLRTVADRYITTPNRVTLVGDDADGGFYITNDKGQHRVGLDSWIAFARLSGDVTFCDNSGCEIVAKGFKFPNGLLLSRDGLLYVPDSLDGTVRVYKQHSPPQNRTLIEVASLNLGYAIDNLSEDASGDIFAAVFPKSIESLMMVSNPMSTWPRSAVFRIRRKAQKGDVGGAGDFQWEKIIEDGKREVLPGSTTVVHDAKTGRLFFVGVTTPFIAVCEPKEKMEASYQ